MSESPENKTKRRFSEYLGLANWSYQYSFFHNDLQTAQECAIQDGATLRRVLARKFRDQPFLYRLCMIKRRDKVEEDVDEATGEITTTKVNFPTLPYHMFLTTQKLPEDSLDDATNYCMDGEINWLYRSRKEEHLTRYNSVIKAQVPHNLKRFFGDKKINRIALLNKKAMI